MSHSMGLAAPGYVEHHLSMHLCQVSQCQLGHIYYWHQSSHIQSMSSGGLPFFLEPGIWKFVIDLIQDMAIPSESLTVKDRCNVLDFKFLL